MKGWTTFIILFCTLACSQVFASIVTHSPLECAREMNPNLTYQALKEWIILCEPKTVAEVVQHLPKNFKTSSTFIYDSKAESEKEHPGTVDPLAPRAILFGNRTLIITFTGKPGTPSYQDIQLLEYKPGAHQFDFKVIQINPRGRSSFNENPRSCKNCHGDGNHTHPIWAAYPNWPGAYGTRDDRLEQDVSDYLEFSRLNNANTRKWPNDGRYAALDEARPLADRYRTDKPLHGYYNQPNLSLTEILGMMYANQIAHRTQTLPSEALMAIESVMLWNRMKCQTRSAENFDFVQYLNKNHIQTTAEDLEHNFLSTLYPEINFDYNVGGTGIPLSDVVGNWILNMNHPLATHLENYFTKPASEYFPGDVGQNLDSVHEIERVGHAYLDTNFTNLITVTTGQNSPALSICKQLTRVFTDALEIATELVPVKHSENNVPNPSRNQLQSCIHCHDGSDPEAKNIRFGNIQELREQLTNEQGLKNRIIEKLENGSMPKFSNRFTPNEVDSVRVYLNYLVN